MNGVTNGSLQPTWFGHVTTAKDALILFEACLNGTLHHVPRRPHDRERSSLIKSGCVFIYEENASGIKRWTDGVPWSPSRILGNFLVYRELMKPFPPGEKKRATKKNKRATKPGEPYPRPADSADLPSPTSGKDSIDNRETERALIGSLVDSYGFKDGGLVKKTMSVNVHGVHHHLVSYYKIEDALDGTLGSPSKDPRLANIEPRPDLIARQNFRAPLDDMDDGLQDPMAGAPNNSYAYNGYRGAPMVSQSGHHPNQLGMSMYSNLPYSSATHVQPGIHSYAPAPSSQSYYPPSSGVLQPVMPKQEDYGAYNQSYPSHGGNLPERTNSLPQSSSGSYSCRPPPASGLMPRLNGMLDTTNQGMEHKPSLDNGSNWSRNGSSSVYGSTANPSPSSQSSYSTSSSHWSVMPPVSQGLPRPEGGWLGAENNSSPWGMQNSIMPRHSNFQATPQSN